MAYIKEKLYKQCEDAIKKHKLFYIEDIVAFIPCNKATFYDYFKIDSDELNNLKEMLEQNKIEIKVGIRSKLYKSEKAAELIALYKLVGTKEERKLLLMVDNDVENTDKVININFGVK